jgi:hypothetical protein
MRKDRWERIGVLVRKIWEGKGERKNRRKAFKLDAKI